MAKRLEKKAAFESAELRVLPTLYKRTTGRATGT
jgi:hypothetical protein